MNLVKLESLIDKLRCPACFSPQLSKKSQQITCSACKVSYPINNFTPNFLLGNDSHTANAMNYFSGQYSNRSKFAEGTFDKLKKISDSIHRPSLMLHLGRIDVSDHLAAADLTLNIGSREKQISSNVVNLDIVENDFLDIQGNVENIPFDNESVDFVNIIAVLHHLKHPEKAVEEIHRVLKPGGYVYAEDHFFYPYHSDPGDCHRWTKEGYLLLFENFNKINIKLIHGPTTTVLNILKFYLPMILSCNSAIIFEIFYILFSYLLFPFKYLDLFVKNHDKADFIAGGYALLGQK